MSINITIKVDNEPAHSVSLGDLEAKEHQQGKVQELEFQISKLYELNTQLTNEKADLAAQLQNVRLPVKGDVATCIKEMPAATTALYPDKPVAGRSYEVLGISGCNVPVPPPPQVKHDPLQWIGMTTIGVVVADTNNVTGFLIWPLQYFEWRHTVKGLTTVWRLHEAAA